MKMVVLRPVRSQLFKKCFCKVVFQHLLLLTLDEPVTHLNTRTVQLAILSHTTNVL